MDIKKLHIPVLLLAAAFLLSTAARAEKPHRLVENFTRALPGNERVETGVITENPRRGLAHARLDYRLDERHGRADLYFPNERYRIPGPGRLTLMIRGQGEGSKHRLRLCVRHAEVQFDRHGRRRFRGQKDVWGDPVPLDFEGWREITFDLRDLPEKRSIWWRCIRFEGPRGEETTREGMVMLDELRLIPARGRPEAGLVTGLIGPKVRSFTREIALFLDGRNFGGSPAQARARVLMTDRNENMVVDRDFRIELKPGEVREQKLALRPERLEAYLPPFTITCDVASEVGGLAGKEDYRLVMGNSVTLFENFADLHGRWFTAGSPHESVAGRHWPGWLHGQAQRYSPLYQTNMRISRVEPAPPENEKKEGRADPTGAHHPPGRYAMKLDYSGPAAVYAGRHRYLPGNAYRLGVWVKGDGSGAELHARFLDYSDMADFWHGGWKRIRDGGRRICRLDFEGWRYLEVALPGNGIGRNTTRGSTDELDFPLALSAFRILPGKEKKSGSVLLGPIFVHTQQPLSDTLAVHLGYDDADRRYAPGRKARVTIHSSRPPLAPGEPQGRVRTTWTLLDRAGDVIATDREEFDIDPGRMRRFEIDFTPHAKKIKDRPGPLRLQVVATDTEDVSVTGRRELILCKPDSLAHLTGFESDRGYLGLKPKGMEQATPSGTPAAVTSDAVAHSGRRSLALPWTKEEGVRAPVSVDPQLPGIPTELSLWVHGDGSGALFYPLIGDRKGVSTGAHGGQWDLFLPRTEQGDLQNVVRVDWTGWKKLIFRLPVIPPNWHEELPVLGFEPSYPLGVHLVVAAGGTETEGGTIYVDDISVRTHLEPAERLDLALRRPGMSNVLRPGEGIGAVVANHAGAWLGEAAKRSVTLAGGIYDWRGRSVADIRKDLDLGAGARTNVKVADKLPIGAYRLRLRLSQGDKLIDTAEADLLVADLVPELGEDWTTDLQDKWMLKKPLGEDFARVEEDWDWVEHHPGNSQLQSMRYHIRRVREKGGAPHVLLGYSAYWAAGPGFEGVRSGSFKRRKRDAGHAVDIFQIPQRMDDWSIYTRSVMRGVGRQAKGWILWNNPDGSGPLAMEPKRFAGFLRTADRWRRRYTPQKPILIGGMNTDTAIPYVRGLAEAEALRHLGGVNVRMDVGRLSPEDARVPRYVRRLQDALGREKMILLTDLDWAVEKGEEGLGVFDQAAYVTRAYLLLDRLGIRPVLSITNPDTDRLGLGLAYRRVIHVPPLRERPDEFLLKPGWWAVLQARRFLQDVEPVAAVEVQDVIPRRTRCLLYRRRDDGRPVAIVWRVHDPAEVSFRPAGLSVTGARDMLGSSVPPDDGWYPVGKMPVIFDLEKTGDAVQRAMRRLRVRDEGEARWPQRVLAAFDPDDAGGPAYEQSGGKAAALGAEETQEGVRFGDGGRESFVVPVPEDSGLVLRKRYYLGETGQQAEVLVNGRKVGTWDLRRSEEQLSSGIRTGIFLVPADAIEGEKAKVELRYDGPANTIRWWAMDYRGGQFPLSAVGPVHADQNVGRPRYGRNMVGTPLVVVETSFENGIGTYARSLIEYSLNGRFRRFRAGVGIDAVTDGKGSVLFEVHADGKKVWSSGVMSGLDEAKEVDVSVEGVKRLRLIVTDAGDGNRYDAANWCEPVLVR